MHIALDSDDVVLDFIGGVCEAVSRDYGVHITPTDITGWEFSDVLDPVLGEPWWEWMRRHAWLWGEKFKPVHGAIGGIEILRRAGHWLEVVTNKPAWAEAEVWKWYGRYKPPVNQVTVVPLDGRRPKHEVTEAVLLIDDKPETCADWVASRPNRMAFLFDHPHNQAAKPVPGVMRVKDWQHIVSLIGKR